MRRGNSVEEGGVKTDLRRVWSPAHERHIWIRAHATYPTPSPLQAALICFLIAGITFVSWWMTH